MVQKANKKEEQIFYQALETSPDQRDSFLKEVCGNDQSLYHRLKDLLAVNDQPDGFLQGSIMEVQVTLDPAPEIERPGTIISRYKLLEKIGEGGMAMVYMAQQEQPIRRKVALKIIKLGMDTKQVIARFEAERQALAMMDHPNIAKVLDAGSTVTGRPYFVMELVQGVSITEYCDKNKLSTIRRLDLFVQVCNAVHHAHQKGIIHRDIKPSNVMVTLHDGKSVPKVIDFGIAKAMNQRLTEKTLFTRYGHMVGTPAYMSPEQAEMSGLDIDTRTDVYSLGVLLYELLTGTTPFDAEKLREAGYVEMQRIIHEEEPTKPSTKLSTLGEALAQIAESRDTKPDLLSRLICGDLDWIVMRSLEKDRESRYDTASALALDVERHLHHEPVLARAPKPIYLLKKLVLRHKSQIAVAAMLIALVSAAAITFSTLYLSRIQRQNNMEFEHKRILSEAQDLFSNGDALAALQRIEPMLDSPHVGLEAQLLYPRILVEGQQPMEAMRQLGDLLHENPEVAGVAGSLMAWALWEGGPTDREQSRGLGEYGQKTQDILEDLLDEAPETAGYASLLLSRVLTEDEFTDAETLRRIDGLQQRARELLPKTAEAYFFRATMALAIKDKLKFLDEALRIDPGHFDSRRLSAFIHYASRKYLETLLDVEVMLVRRPRDPLGHSLRAMALQQLGDYERAIEAYGRAIEYAPEEDLQNAKLYDQRCQIFLRMTRYDRAIADARACLKLSSDEAMPNFRIFCALTARGDYEEARKHFSDAVGNDLERRQRFRDWSLQYVFDSLEAGQSWHRPNSQPEGVAFLAMLEAEETYHELSDKARRLITNGFSADWSPDGTELAFSLGVLGSSGIAIFDTGSQQTELLIVPGKDPKWSPDGEYIAFVRDCRSIRLSELAAAERRDQRRSFLDEEVWIMKKDGTDPRRLARGGWPSWTQDSRHVYYHSRSDQALYSICIDDREVEPKLILPCSNFFPSVSPDNTHVAYVEGQLLKIIDFASQSLVSECVVPPQTLAGRWMPDGRHLGLRCYNDSEFKTGLWIYDIDSERAVKVLAGQIDIASLDPTEMELAFNLGQPLYEIWTAKLDPSTSTIEALGPGRTLDEHLEEMVAFYTRRIVADPGNADSYLRRAQYYHYLHDEEKVHTDMPEYRAILNPPNGTNGYPLKLDTGGDQEGHSGFVLGTPLNLGPMVNSTTDDVEPSISNDGLELYFASYRPGGFGDCDVWVTKRTTVDDEWGGAINLGPLINSSAYDGGTSLSPDGSSLYFTTARGNGAVMVTRRDSKSESWGTPEIAYRLDEWGAKGFPSLSSDNLEMYICEYYVFDPDGFGLSDLWVSTRSSDSDAWNVPQNLGPIVNSSAHDRHPSISADGLALFFSSYRPGGYGDQSPPNDKQDIWVATRANENTDWGTPKNLGPTVNTSVSDGGPSISADGRTLYFYSRRPGGYGRYDIWQASIAPILRSSRRDSDAHLVQKLAEDDDGKEVMPADKH